jgi:hypothetical protein
MIWINKKREEITSTICAGVATVMLCLQRAKGYASAISTELPLSIPQKLRSNITCYGTNILLPAFFLGSLNMIPVLVYLFLKLRVVSLDGYHQSMRICRGFV